MTVTLSIAHIKNELSQYANWIKKRSHHTLVHYKKNAYQRQLGDLTFDFSRSVLTDDIIDQLIHWAEACSLKEKIQDLFAGKKINISEEKAALHWVMRLPSNKLNHHDKNHTLTYKTLSQMLILSQAIWQKKYLGITQKPIDTIVHIGMGGSLTGPLLAHQALDHNAPLNFHFLGSLDPDTLSILLSKINPETTLFIVVSKSFNTLETLENATLCRQWLVSQLSQDTTLVNRHFIAVTENYDAAKAFGVSLVLPLLPEVGGRYSIWSAVGFTTLLQIGEKAFYDFLKGAHTIDEHFCNTHFNDNIPVVLALIHSWYFQYLQYPALAVLPYTQRLKMLPRYCQQLEMESNGKSVTLGGHLLDTPACPVVFGDTGTEYQHGFLQWLHQGGMPVALDMWFARHTATPFTQHQRWQHVNGLAQANTLWHGCAHATLQRDLAGGQPSQVFEFDTLTPYRLGTLLALYEHKVFTQSVLLNINPFDQWAVEAGKQEAKRIFDSYKQNP